MADENTSAAPASFGPGAGAPAAPQPNAAPAAPTTEAQAPAADTVTADGGQAPAGDTPPTDGLVTPPEQVTTVLESTADEDGAITYEATGDPALDVALEYLGKLGFAGDDTAMVRAATGDFAMLEAQLAALGDKAAGWERMVALAKSAYASSETKRTEQVAAVEKSIVSVVGSKEQWQSIVTWAAKTADPEEKAEINRMIDAGPIQARAAATLLLSAYQKAQGTSVPPRSAVRDAAGGVPASGNGPLNAKDYATAVRDLSNKLGNRMEGSQEYADLQRRLR